VEEALPESLASLPSGPPPLDIACRRAPRKADRICSAFGNAREVGAGRRAPTGKGVAETGRARGLSRNKRSGAKDNLSAAASFR